MDIELSKTWIFDLDGTIIVHGGVPTVNGWEDLLLPQTRAVFDNIPQKDYIVFITARSEMLKNQTERFLKQNHIRYDHIIFGVGAGPRIIFNDTKPNGTITCHAVPVVRNIGVTVDMIEKFL
jgi:FMN phosphatase YigB (HAD superfamily)